MSESAADRDNHADARRTSLRCCAPLTVEDHSLQAMPDASPAKWHLAHTTWFFETFLLTEYSRDIALSIPLSATSSIPTTTQWAIVRCARLRHTLSRPTLDEVHAYRSHVDEAMARLLALELPPAVVDLVTLGLNHEQQHQELILTDVKYGLALNPLRPAYRELATTGRTCRRPLPRCGGTRFPRVYIPVGFEGDGFAFDNESPRHNVYLAPFRWLRGW